MTSLGREFPGENVETPALSRCRFVRALAIPFFACLFVCGLARSGAAQVTGFVLYYGKNNIHYDTFEWHIYTTEHFEIYYYPETRPHLEQIASDAESAYQHVSADLRHDLPKRVPLIVFKTHSDFEQENIDPGGAEEGVLAFAEPDRNRMLLPIDLPSDQLYGLIVARANAPVFEYDILPTALVRQNIRCGWTKAVPKTSAASGTRSILMTIRDAADHRHHPEDDPDLGHGPVGRRAACPLRSRARRRTTSSQPGGARRASARSCSPCARA